jgi:hypothetical protein
LLVSATRSAVALLQVLLVLAGTFASHAPSMGGKWLEVLKETAPHVTQVLAIMHVENEVHQAFWQSIEDAAQRLAIETTAGRVQNGI